MRRGWRKRNIPHGFCAVHRVESCQEDHPGGELRPCRSCPMDWPASEFKPYRRYECRRCFNARQSTGRRDRYHHDPAYRAKVVARESGRVRPAEAYRVKKAKDALASRARHRARQIAARGRLVYLGLVEYRKYGASRAHVVVRDGDRERSACGKLPMLGRDIQDRSRLRMCLNCQIVMRDVRLVVQPAAPWRPSLPVVVLEATA
jgi:hypothetical protein